MKTTTPILPVLAALPLLATGCAVIPFDPPADALDAVAFVVDEQSAEPGRTLCVLRLSHDGTLVDSLGPGGVVCNEARLAFDQKLRGFAALVPRAGSGATYRFTYVHESVPTKLDVPVPAPLRLAAGDDPGARLPRTPALPISLVSPPDAVIEVVATGPSGAEATAAFDPRTDESLVVDTSQLAAGPGTLRVSCRREAPVPESGFRTARWDYLQVLEMDVAWD